MTSWRPAVLALNVTASLIGVALAMFRLFDKPDVQPSHRNRPAPMVLRVEAEQPFPRDSAPDPKIGVPQEEIILPIDLVCGLYMVTGTCDLITDELEAAGLAQSQIVSIRQELDSLLANLQRIEIENSRIVTKSDGDYLEVNVPREDFAREVGVFSRRLRGFVPAEVADRMTDVVSVHPLVSVGKSPYFLSCTDADIGFRFQILRNFGKRVESVYDHTLDPPEFTLPPHLQQRFGRVLEHAKSLAGK